MSEPTLAVKTVLFLCTGNYYRSRFAEIVFNSLAEANDLLWRADSRGLQLTGANYGPISQHTITGLEPLKISPPDPVRFPIRVSEADLAAASLIVALKEAEHRPMFEMQFPAWTARVEFWQIHDIDCCEPADALPELLATIVDLVARLEAQERMTAEE